MVQPATPKEMIALLDDGQEETFVGMEETDWLDSKGAPYRLGERREQWELAKDVAALANAAGGIIVVGVHTSRPTRRDEEKATEVAPFPASMFDAKQLRDVVAAQVYPRIEITVRTFDRPDEKRLALVVVQQQDDDRRPFLLTRVFDDERRWEAMALPVRSGPVVTRSGALPAPPSTAPSPESRCAQGCGGRHLEVGGGVVPRRSAAVPNRYG